MFILLYLTTIYIANNWGEYRFQVKRSGVEGDSIDPYSDDRITAAEMKAFLHLIFEEEGVDLGTGTLSPMSVEYVNRLPVSELKSAARKIRSEHQQQGTMYKARARYYRFYFTEATLAPEYLDGPSPVKTEGTLNYLNRWAGRSIYNFKLYKEFMKQIEKTKSH